MLANTSEVTLHHLQNDCIISVFSKDNLWNIYNLFTKANKSSYIDTFLDRNLDAFDFTQGIQKALNGDSKYHWFLS
ncbi:DUF3871 family protein [Chryseobacterium ginsenosidimutans]|uniref:DUF3871 family protein n=1 Tax=Chryseobacterium ginsenosidimutans TaxID=687846 RepID=UPI0031E3B5FC